MRRSGVTAIGTVVLLSGLAQAAETDVLLKAMRDEMTRSRALKVVNLETPYYIEYAIDDAFSFSAAATLGGLIVSNHNRFRQPRIQIRVGDYKFDNTNYIGSSFNYGSQYDIERFPLENVYAILRRYLWLATDSAYKSAVAAIARKRAALNNLTVSENVADFAKAQPIRRIEDVHQPFLPEEVWTSRVRSLSAIFANYPQILNSGVEFEAVRNVRYLLTSEGTELRIPETLVFLRGRASAQAPDGMMLRDGIVFHSLQPDKMPIESELKRGLDALAGNVVALASAPRAEVYSGPVLFEGVAASQIFAEVLGRNLVLTRKPVVEQGRPGGFPTSELEGRMGARIMPEWMDVVDDPTQTDWRGRPLFGHYSVDLEGVEPKPLSLVEKGVLKTFFLTRQPIRGFEGSNGRARMPGNFGAKAAGMSNLFVRASEVVSGAQLKKKMMDICQSRNKAYGIIVRKMDFPSSASVDEVRRLLSGSGQQGGGSRPVSLPILVYRIYPDGREELVRGLRFRGLNARSLKDILAASDDNNVFDFLDNTAPFALMGAGNFTTETCVIAPSILIDDLELHPIDDETPKLPIVPAPALSTGS